MSYAVIGRDAHSVDSFGQTVRCNPDDAYSVHYYGQEEDGKDGGT
jgi:hypothetical protein